MTTTTKRRRFLTRSERRQLVAIAAAVWPLAVKLGERIDPAREAKAGNGIAAKLHALAASALQVEARLLPARELRGLHRRVVAA